MGKKFCLLALILVVILSWIQCKSVIENQHEYSFMTFNIWQEGTSVENGLEKIRDVVIEANADVVCFTEVRNYEHSDWTSKVVNELKAKGLTYYRGYSGGDVSIISKYPISASSLIYKGQGSIAQFKINVPDQEIVVACAHLDYTFYACYLPRGYNGGEPNWNIIDNGEGIPEPLTDLNQLLNYNLLSERDEQISAFIDSMNSENNPIILMGDFNEPSHLDWTEKTKTLFDHNNVVMEWPTTKALEDNGFIDAYRDFFSSERLYPGVTWPSLAHGVKPTTWTPLADERDRIDYIFYKGEGISTSFASLVGPKASYAFNKLDTSIISEENFIASELPWPSDHKAVFVKLKF